MKKIKKSQFVFATYLVKIENQNAFITLLKKCEAEMRKENLITSQPIFRMNSNKNPEIIIEVFEWKDPQSFESAQNSSNVLKFWMQYEQLWVKGGFGINEIPESNIPWAQFSSLE